MLMYVMMAESIFQPQFVWLKDPQTLQHDAFFLFLNSSIIPAVPADCCSFQESCPAWT